LTFLHTPGHALHHVSIVDEEARGIFAGDTFGVSYRELDGPRGEFIFPATTPVHFDPDAAHASIDRLMAERPTAIYLTHYSRVADLERLASSVIATKARRSRCRSEGRRSAGPPARHRCVHGSANTGPPMRSF